MRERQRERERERERERAQILEEEGRGSLVAAVTGSFEASNVKSPLMWFCKIHKSS